MEGNPAGVRLGPKRRAPFSAPASIPSATTLPSKQSHPSSARRGCSLSSGRILVKPYPTAVCRAGDDVLRRSGDSADSRVLPHATAATSWARCCIARSIFATRRGASIRDLEKTAAIAPNGLPRVGRGFILLFYMSSTLADTLMVRFRAPCHVTVRGGTFP
jgi:hypothetical protein